MHRLISSHYDTAALILRSAFAVMMMTHGWSKLVNYEQLAAVFPDPFGVGSAASLSLAIFAELVCSLLLLVGLGTKLALVPLVFTMLVAIFYAHAGDPWQKKELATAYLFAYGALLASGPGRYSLDYLLFGKRLQER